MKRNLTLIMAALIVLLSPGIASALPVIPGFELPPTDMSYRLLHMLLGGIVDLSANNAATVSDPTAIVKVLAAICPIIAIVGVLLMSYTMLVGVLNTANEGEAFGRNWSTLWLPFRSSAAMALILPIPKLAGLCAVQFFVVWLAMIGAAGGNRVWHASVNAFDSKPVFIDDKPLDISPLSTALENSLCMYAYQKNSGNSGETMNPGVINAGTSKSFIASNFDAYIKASPVYSEGNVLYRNVTWGDQSNARHVSQNKDCGSMKIMVGYTASAGHVTGDTRGFIEQIGGWLSDTYTNHFGSDAQKALVSDHADQMTAVSKLREKTAENFATTVMRYIKPMDNIAYNIVTTGGNPNVTDAQLQKIVQTYKAAILKPITTGSDAAVGGIEQEFKDDINRDGWAYAGAYFWNLVKMTETLDLVANQTVRNKAAIRTGVGHDIERSSYPAYYSAMEKVEVKMNGYADVASGISNAQDATATTLADGPLDRISAAVGGMILHFMRDNSQNPLISMKRFGDLLLNVGFFFLVTAGIMKVAGWFTPGKRALSWLGSLADKNHLTRAITSSVKAVGSFVGFLGIALLIAAFMFAYYLPAIPFIIWVSAVTGWLVYVLEAMIAAPLWIVMHAHPDGQGISSDKGANGYMLLLGLLLRPTLMIVGLVVSLALTYVMGYFVNDTLIASQRFLDPDSSRGLFAMMSTLFLYAAIVYKIIDESFSMIHKIHDSVMRWIGGDSRNLGEDSAADHSKSMILAAAHGIKNDVNPALKNPMGGGGGPDLKGASITSGSSKSDSPVSDAAKTAHSTALQHGGDKGSKENDKGGWIS